MSDSMRMQAAADDCRTAANRMSSAADEMKQAARNMDGAVDRIQMIWERQIHPDLCTLVDRLEALSKEISK